MQPGSFQYVLLTPARDEAAFIERTIQSVLAQTVLPVRWVLISDGSTDGTDEIVQRYTEQHAWISLIRMPARRERHFAGKVYAFNAGYASVKDLHHEFIGNLDGDTSFEPDYFEHLLTNLVRNPRLGLVGTNYFESSLKYDSQFTASEDVPGICQLFRRECFEAVGGYQPLEAGGVDLVAVLTARMHGWETRVLPGKSMHHLRPQGTASGHALMVHFVHGEHDYKYGAHPLWEVFRVAFRMTRQPFVVAGCLLGAGYVSALLRRTERPVSGRLIRFRRREQMSRLRRFLVHHLRRVTVRGHASLVLAALGYICAECADLLEFI